MIRPLEPPDAPAATALLAESLGGRRTPGDLLDPPLHTHHRICIEGGIILGVMAYRVVVDEAELCEIAVRPGARRQGIGRRLLGHLLADAAERGARALYLEVRVGNRPARRLYEAAGFEAIGTRRGYYADGESATLYRRSLDGAPAAPPDPQGDRP